jgi:hypothetical protein
MESSEGRAPRRIQRKRTRGWKMPPNTVYVGRPTRWGNLWKVGLVSCGCRSAGECMHNSFRCQTAQEAVDMFRMWVTEGHKTKHDAKLILRGKNLACWCPLDQPCHADVLLAFANE